MESLILGLAMVRSAENAMLDMELSHLTAFPRLCHASEPRPEFLSQAERIRSACTAVIAGRRRPSTFSIFSPVSLYRHESCSRVGLPDF